MKTKKKNPPLLQEVYREALILLRDRMREAESGAELNISEIVTQLDRILTWKGEEK